jgi:hypothetical protein
MLPLMSFETGKRNINLARIATLGESGSGGTLDTKRFLDNRQATRVAMRLSGHLTRTVHPPTPDCRHLRDADTVRRDRKNGAGGQRHKNSALSASRLLFPGWELVSSTLFPSLF